MRPPAPPRPPHTTFATEQEATSRRTRAALRAALEELVLPEDEKLDGTVKIEKL